MDRKLQAPFIPPKDKLISEAEMRNMEKKGKSILEEIKVLELLIIKRKNK